MTVQNFFYVDDMVVMAAMPEAQVAEAILSGAIPDNWSEPEDVAASANGSSTTVQAQFDAITLMLKDTKPQRDILFCLQRYLRRFLQSFKQEESSTKQKCMIHRFLCDE